MIRNGGLPASMVRICTGLVWVRSSSGRPSPLGLQVEGVEHLPGRMLGRDVERLEIVPVVLDVRAFGHGEAHVGEDRDDLLGGLADRVDAALAAARAPAG